MERALHIRLHKEATTTPKVRAAIQASDEPAWVLAERYGTAEQTVWKWRKRDSVENRIAQSLKNDLIFSDNLSGINKL